jgi:hypothetical protein
MQINSFVRYSLLIFICTLKSIDAFSQAKHVVSGYVAESGSREMLAGATIAIPKYKTGTVTNGFGFYSITLPADTFEVIVSYVGYKAKAFRVNIFNADVSMNIELEANKMLKEVVIEADKKADRLSQMTRMSVIEIPVSQVRDIPALLGEKDVLKVIQLLPGVQKPSEGNSGIYVRGGGPDQNLIILDDATVYNAFHLFGFFSLFNGDALKSIELTKGGFPARYGGRLSSVIDMRMKEGNKEKFKGEAGIGLLSSRLILEGPIIKKKSSFIISGRRTYFDLLTLPFQPANNRGGYYFYDLNAKSNYEFNDRNKLYVSGYFGRDKFYATSTFGNQKDEFGLGWGNATATLRWNHLFNNKLFANASFIFTNYDFTVSQKSGDFTLNFTSGIRDYAVKYDLDYRPNSNHSIKAGFQSTYHVFTPSALVAKSTEWNLDLNKVNRITAIENGIYVEDDIHVGSKLRLNPGLRFSHFNTQQSNYYCLEPRFNSSYNISSTLAVKASASIMNQYIHLLSNTGVGLPTDLWVPSSNFIKPQQSWQVAGGVTKDVIQHHFSVSVEGYYKHMNNTIAYKDGASFLGVSDDGTGESALASNYNWEKNITLGQGWSYGAEFLVQKKVGKLTGWVGYTLSWTQFQFDELNEGKAFWARYDRRHDISVVAIYKLLEQEGERNGITLSATWVYGTGNAITLPIAEFSAPIHQVAPSSNNSFLSSMFVNQYTGKNQFRMAPYHRMDLGIQISKKKPLWVRTWEFSIYNVYNRYNPYFYYIGSDGTLFNPGNNRVLRQITLFPIIPSVSWNIKF